MLTQWTSWATVERGLALSTVQAYSRELRSLEHSEGSLLGLQPDALRRFLHDRRGSASTVSRRVSAFRSYFGWLIRTGQRGDDPSAQLDRPKTHRGLPRPVADVAAAFAGFDSETRAIAVFLVLTGLRISEACAVFVRPPTPTKLLVLGKGSKERRVPLTPEARAALDALGGAIPVSARTVQRRFAKAGFNPHRLRHSFASQLAEADVDTAVISQLLGHASVNTTMIYTQISQRRLREAVDRSPKPTPGV